MPEKKSPHIWIWITIILLVVIVLVVIFVIRDKKYSQDALSSENVIENMTVPEYNYSEQDSVRIEQEIAESNELFLNAFSGEGANGIENQSETEKTVIDSAQQEKIQQSNEEFMNMFNQSNL